jgi:hypothetical protein
MNLRDFDDLTVEEIANLQSFQRELDKLTQDRNTVLQESEISNLEAVLNSIIEEIASSVRQQTDKSNA